MGGSAVNNYSTIGYAHVLLYDIHSSSTFGERFISNWKILKQFSKRRCIFNCIELIWSTFHV